MSELAPLFYEQNQWANRQMLDLCRTLSDAQLDATAPGTYGSIRSTLQHLVAAEAGYVFRLGTAPTRRLRGDDPWPGFDVLAEVAAANAAALVAACATEPGRVIRVGTDDEPRDTEASVILIQAFNHSTEHRSQINTILTTLGVEPPELSGWEWGMATDRMRRV